MKAFAQLYVELDATTSTAAKLAALARYYAVAPAEDAAWATYFLAGGRPRLAVPSRLMRECAVAFSGLPEWLFDECYDAVGDFAETVAHVLPPPAHRVERGLAQWVDRLAALRGQAPEAIRERLFECWDELDWNGRFLMLKLVGGGFRVGVSKLLVTRALATHAGLDGKLVAQRLVGYTQIDAHHDAEAFRALVAPADAALGNPGHPYPFFLAQQLVDDVASLGDPADWRAEWKWDGIRAQLVAREGEAWIWSRGEELVTERFPELHALGLALLAAARSVVLDGEIVVWREGRVQPFAELQTRIGRKSLTPKFLASMPVAFVAYDLLEEDGEDLRGRSQDERRVRLEALVARAGHPRLELSPRVEAADWAGYAALRAESRGRGVEGLMLKHRDARYGVGRTRSDGLWWKWKIDPMSVDAVLVYAQRGHGRRASLYTDYTFAVWNEARELIPFAKAYSGLTDEEIAEVDAIVRRTTVEKFGPVRSVTPTQVFELGFEGIQRSTRHKSGIAVRFPRMLRWRKDKPVDEADTLASLESLLGRSR